MATPGVSLTKLGLRAVDGLDCPEGGLHHVLEPELIIAAAQGGGVATCRRCGQEVLLASTKELES